MSIAIDGAARPRIRSKSLFYGGMSVAFIIVVFAGFARTYYLRPYFEPRPLIPLLHVVALRMTTPERALYFSLAGVAILLLLWLWYILVYQAQAIGAKLEWTIQRMITIVFFWLLLGWYRNCNLVQ